MHRDKERGRERKRERERERCKHAVPVANRSLGTLKPKVRKLKTAPNGKGSLGFLGRAGEPERGLPRARGDKY